MNRRCILTSCWYHKKQNRLVKHVKRFPLVTQYIQQLIQSKERRGEDEDIEDLYGKNIEGFKTYCMKNQ